MEGCSTPSMCCLALALALMWKPTITLNPSTKLGVVCCPAGTQNSKKDVRVKSLTEERVVKNTSVGTSMSYNGFGIYSQARPIKGDWGGK